MFDNPLIRRYRYSLMRPAQFWVYTTIYITIIGLMLLINYGLYRYQDTFTDLPGLYTSIYTQLLIIQTIMLLLWASFNSNSAISLERIERTYDFFKILPMSAWKKMTGILMGKNLVVFLLAAINLVFLVSFGRAGNVSPNMLLQTLFIMASGTVLCNTTGLLCSLCSKSKTKGSKVGGILLMLIFGVPLLINGIIALAEINKLEGFTASFYSLKLPVLILSSLIAIYFAIWTVIGILRKLNKEERPLFSRFGSILFIAGYYVIITGLLLPHFSDYLQEMVIAYWWFTLIPVVTVPFATIFDMQSYFEFAASCRRKNLSSKKSLSAFLGMSNVTICIVIFILWVTALYLLNLHPMVDIPLLTPTVLTLASFYLFLMLLMETAITYEPAHGRIALLVGFIAVAYIILPPIFGGILENETIISYSPAGFFVMALAKDSQENYPFIMICAYNLLLSIVPAILIFRRYAQIVSYRQAK